MRTANEIASDKKQLPELLMSDPHIRGFFKEGEAHRPAHLSKLGSKTITEKKRWLAAERFSPLKMHGDFGENWGPLLKLVDGVR